MTDNTGRAHVRAEESHIVETLALPPGLLASDLPSNAKRQEIDVPLNGFQVNRVLTEAECDRLVAVAEKKGFDSIAWEYDPVRGFKVNHLAVFSLS